MLKIELPLRYACAIVLYSFIITEILNRFAVSEHHFYTAAALLAMQSAVLATAIPIVCPSVCHTLVPYTDE